MNKNYRKKKMTKEMQNHEEVGVMHDKNGRNNENI